MIRVDPRARVMLAIDAADFRCGIDGIARLCEESLRSNPRSGTVFVFRNRARTAMKLLVYDNGGYWLCLRRLSAGSFEWWPRSGRMDEKQVAVAASDLTLLVGNGVPRETASVEWMRIPRRSGVSDMDVDARKEKKRKGAGSRRRDDEQTRPGRAP